jgi:hypothetical protein
MRTLSRRTGKREIRLLESELRMLEHYYIQCIDLIEDYQSEWNEDLLYFTKRFASDESEQKQDEDSDNSNSTGFQMHDHTRSNAEDEDKEHSKIDEMPAWAKRLYKKIAMITHPDRISSEERRQTLERVFLRASEAARSGNYEDLIAIALEFDLEAGLDDASLRPVLKTQIGKVKKKIREIETEVPWVWGESFGMHDIRCRILRPTLAQRKILLTDDEVIAAIKERESQFATG